MTKAVTFAPTVDIVDRDVKEKLQEDPAAESSVILLVEDNPVLFSSSAYSKERRLTHPFQMNQKLGKRMLTVSRTGMRADSANKEFDASGLSCNHRSPE